MTVGILVLSELTAASAPFVDAVVQNQKVISNIALRVPYKLLQLGTVDMETRDRIVVDASDSSQDLTQLMPMYGEMTIQMASRVDRLLIVSPGPNVPAVYGLIASQHMANGLNDVRLAVGGTLYSGEQIATYIAQNKEQVRRHWDRIFESHTAAKTKLETIETPSGATLRPYQQQAVEFALEKKRAGLFIDMGLGKTLSTLAAIDKLLRTDQIDATKPILIVAPIMVALDTWARESSKWGYDMAVKINIHLAGKKREALLESLLEPQEKPTLVTTNPAQLPQMLKFFSDRHVSPPFEVVVVDELSQFKSPTAKRFDQLRKLSNQATYFFGLTGTPAPNNLLDIWSQLMVIDPKNGERFGYSFFQYRNRYFEPDVVSRDGNTVYSWKLKRGAEDQIYRQMRGNVLSMRSEGLLELPDIVYDKVYVKLPPKAKKLYNKLDVELRQKLNDEFDDSPVLMDTGKNEIMLPNNAVLTSKLAQLAGGALYDSVLEPEDDGGKYAVFHDEKFKALKDIVENATSPVFILFYFKSDLERMRKFFDFEHLDPHRKDVVNLIARWNRGEVPVLVGHPASIGHGLNLQDGGHIMIWLTTTWSNEQYRQTIKRLYRSGQTHTVSVVHIVAEGTIDEEIVSRLNLKEDGQQRMLKALEDSDNT